MTLKVLKVLLIYYTVEPEFLTWNKEHQNEVDVVGEPAHHEQDHHYQGHLHYLPLLLHGPGDGWLPDSVIGHPEHLVTTTPQLSTNHSVAISYRVNIPSNIKTL